MSQGNKMKAVQTAIQNLEKQYGKGTAMRMGDQTIVPVSHISTGSLRLDSALGVGGIPKGRIIEVYGPESSGKTTATLQIIANAQKEGGIAAFIDAEHALSPQYAEALGIDVDNLIISQPDCGEQALEVAEALIRSGGVDLVVVDSVSALVPRQEIEGDMGDTHVGLQARLMSQAMRKLAGAVHKTNSSLIFINQLREKVGVMFGSPEVTSGGRSLKFYSSVRIDIRRKESLKQGTDIIGNRVRAKVVKNKVAPPFKEAEIDIIFGKGFCRTGELVDLGVETGSLEKAGSWYSYGDSRLGQGREKAKEALDNDPAMRETVEKQVKEALFPDP